VLPDLLSELDQLPPRERLLSLVQGILAANIFDWGAKACVELYTNGKEGSQGGQGWRPWGGLECIAEGMAHQVQLAHWQSSSL
jgi:hypothetical protein